MLPLRSPAFRAFSGSRLYCITQMQEERVEREKGACVWTEMDLISLNMPGVL